MQTSCCVSWLRTRIVNNFSDYSFDDIVILIFCTNLNRWILGDTYVINTGYLELAESNGIIIIFPQVVPTPDEGLLRGCWNWYGYLGDTDYDTKNGDQMAGVWKMILKMGYVPVDPAGNTGSRQTLSFLVLFLALYRCFSLLL